MVLDGNVALASELASELNCTMSSGHCSDGVHSLSCAMCRILTVTLALSEKVHGADVVRTLMVTLTLDVEGHGDDVRMLMVTLRLSVKVHGAVIMRNSRKK